MKRIFVSLSLIALAGLISAKLLFAAEAKVDQPAPDFTLVDTGGKTHSLSDYKGKFVVLEWVNFDCPFVGKHYGSGHMQELQKTYRDKGVIWMSICSSAPGKQGYFEGEELTERMAKEKTNPTAYLIDKDGTVGRMYGAKTTPHMYIINPDGVLIYAGGIDDRPSTRLSDIEGATNYVEQALDAAMEGKPVEVKTATPYGCSVKYARK